MAANLYSGSVEISAVCKSEVAAPAPGAASFACVLVLVVVTGWSVTESVTLADGNPSPWLVQCGHI